VLDYFSEISIDNSWLHPEYFLFVTDFWDIMEEINRFPEIESESHLDESISSDISGNAVFLIIKYEHCIRPFDFLEVYPNRLFFSVDAFVLDLREPYFVSERFERLGYSFYFMMKCNTSAEGEFHSLKY